ncbi:flagellar hook-associated protein FlgK [Sphingosinicella microcystinivorans]|uniref:flagellar hook-associated protein FlgK n=1 Tax=Sphingosinicella microcystinivorans TaxID=335406 RepID=UPI0022F3E456|nr:flagellar hook-associated protein FlgK [Sphingosinicella microcystinivorans]WBX82361.1 flagellar hook-associated protein FlgK [Sphingosinicella microcystinivorans]
MSDLLSLGASGVRAYQTALDIVGENIANANVAGYSRRTAMVTENPSAGGGFPLVRQTAAGSGVNVSGVARAYDAFLASDARTASGDYARAQTRQYWLSEIQSFLNTGSQGLSGRLTAFYNAAQDVAADPTALSARDAFLSAAGEVAAQFRSLAQSFDATRVGIKQDVDQTVDRINDLTSALSTLNGTIRRTAAGTSASASLADERDRLLNELATLTKIDVTVRGDGTVDLRLDNANGPILLDQMGAKLLGATEANGKIRLTLDPFGSSGTIPVPGSGVLAGLSDAYTQNSDSTAAIDTLAQQFITSVNAAHRQGVDLNGVAGGDLFAASSLVATPSRTNTGQATLDMQVTDESLVFAGGYELWYDGATSQWTLSRADGSASVTGSGTLDLDGIHLELGGAPRGGDWFQVSGVSGAAGMRVLVGDGADVAAAAPWSADISAANQGTGTAAVRSNLAAATIPAPVPTSFTVRMGAGNTYEIIDTADTAVPPAVLASGPYVPGAWIPVNGFDVQLSGAVAEGDSFVVVPTAAGMADNANMLRMIDTRLGSPGFEGRFAREVTRVATSLNDTKALASATLAMRDKALEARDAASAVNLDEEAADLIRFQQAYQASAKIIAAAREIFQTIIDIR